jgi:hypothetical protein
LQSNGKNEVLANYAKMKLGIPLDKLTKEILDNLPETELEPKICAKILEALTGVARKGEKDEVIAIERLPESQRLIYYSVILDDEVCNGGFSQYYLNHAGLYALETVRAVRLLQYPRMIDLLEKSIGAFMILIASGFNLWLGDISKWNEKSSKLDKEYFLSKVGDSTFETLDDEYYLIRNEFEKRRIEFIRANVNHYVI